jgi:hypothetical protein
MPAALSDSAGDFGKVAEPADMDVDDVDAAGRASSRTIPGGEHIGRTSAAAATREVRATTEGKARILKTSI